MGDHEIKILNFPDGTTFLLLRDINRNTRIQSILRSHKEASGSKTNFSKFRPYELRHIKIESINQDKWYDHSCTLIRPCVVDLSIFRSFTQKHQCNMCWLFDYFSRFIKNFLCYLFQKQASKDHLTQRNLVWKCMEISLYTPNNFQTSSI